MGSPFPGMDPYLEGDLWQEFHERLANQISMLLMPKLGSKYVALLAKRYEIKHPALELLDLSGQEHKPLVFYPDVHLVERSSETATATIAETITLESVDLPTGVDIPQLSIEIRDIAERRLVTVIEILSPANKGGVGLFDYMHRRKELLQSWTNLLEIDLLRGGRRISLGGTLPPASYYVYMVRAISRQTTRVWPIQLKSRLPIVPVPLLYPDPDVTLNLQEAVDGCFALVGYERLLDYSAPLPPPELSQLEQEWIAAQLQAVAME